MFYDYVILFLFCLAVYVINYKPKLNDKTLIVNYLTFISKKKRSIFDAAQANNPDLL